MLKTLMRLTDTTAKTAAAAVVLTVVVGYADYLTGYEIAVSFFYLLPILLVTWRLNLRYGMILCVICAIIWLMNDYWLTEHFYTHPLIPYWNTLVGFTFFATSTLLLDRIKSLLQREKAQAKLKSLILHTISHEFNSALTVMSTGLFLLKKERLSRSSDTLSKLVTALDNSQAQMSFYVDNILKDAWLDDGGFKLEIKPLLLRELMQGSVDSMKELFDHKGITVEIKISERPLYVGGDRDALSLVMSNLLSNAIKYTPQNGRIVIDIFSSGDSPNKIIFSIKDTGIGISLTDLQKITAGFYRNKEGEIKSTSGEVGLGLKVTDHLLQLHGSRLQVVSEKDIGSCFFFALPALTPAKPEVPDKSADL